MLLFMRSFVFKETKASFSTPKGEFGQYLLNTFQEQKKRSERLFRVESFIQSKNPSWDNNYLCQSMSKDAPFHEVPQTQQDILSKFPRKFETFCDEYCLGNPIVEYPIDP